jgi:hypothetical protein
MCAIAHIVMDLPVILLWGDANSSLGLSVTQSVNGGVVNQPWSHAMNTKPNALDAYLASTVAIHTKLARLQQLADDHFGHDPDAIDWGHVGDLGRVKAALDDLLAIFNKTV